jgi:hypothetical protein
MEIYRSRVIKVRYEKIGIDRGWGGIAIYTKHHIYRCEKPEFNSDEIEIIWSEINTGSFKAIIGVLYRPPQSDASFWQKLEGSIQPINDLNIPVLLASDFNIDMMGNQ